MVKKAEEWFPLYVGHYHRDTNELTTEQHGAYLLLLMSCWMKGGKLPNDDARLASIAKLTVPAWKKHASVIRAFFQDDGEHLTHKRVTFEYEKAQELSRRASENGAKGGRPRKLNETQKKPRGLATGNPEHNPNHKLNETPPPPQDRVIALSGQITPIQVNFSNLDLREEACQRMGPDWVLSWLDPCGWQDVPEPAILARNAYAADVIRRELRPILSGISVKLMDRAA